MRRRGPERGRARRAGRGGLGVGMGVIAAPPSPPSPLPPSPLSPAALAAYLARIGLDAPPAGDAAGLAMLQAAHRRAIPFENLAIPLGEGIDLTPDHVFDKLVMRRRGGYCFEQNQLYGRALAALGMEVRPLLARVWLMAGEGLPPLTHTLNLVTIDGRAWIADAGFGGSFVPPMPLEDGAEATTPDGARHRLRRAPADTGADWMLERAGDPRATDGRAADHGDWQRQYGFTMAAVAPIDLELSNHWTATRPGTRFTMLAIASIVRADGFVALTGNIIRVVSGDITEQYQLSDPAAYRAALTRHFGIDLSAAAAERLFAWILAGPPA